MTKTEKTTDELELFREVIEPIKRERFSAGFKSAIAVLREALDKIEAEGPQGGDVASAPIARRKLFVPQPGGPKPGTTPYVILQVMTTKPNEGLTSNEIIQAVKETGHTAPEASVKTNIFRLKERKMIVPRHGKWFLAG